MVCCVNKLGCSLTVNVYNITIASEISMVKFLNISADAIIIKAFFNSFIINELRTSIK